MKRHGVAILCVCGALMGWGCARTQTPAPGRAGDDPRADQFVQAVHEAHGAEAYHDHEAVRADFQVNFGDKIHLAGTMTFMTNQAKVRMDLDDGSVIVYNQGNAWVKSSHDMPRARFNVLTWPWFMTLPFQLGGSGVHLETPKPTAYQNGKTLPAARMTFDSGMGDSPDDWYILFKDPKTNRLTAAAYIVTYGKTLAEAEKTPHVILYRDDKTIDGVTFATTWQFSGYDRAKGITGQTLGRGTASNIRFVKPSPSMFEKPPGSKPATKP